jgi:hypothetical protein
MLHNFSESQRIRRIPTRLGVWRRKDTLVTISRSSDRDSRDPGRGETGNAKAGFSRLLECRVTKECDQHPKVESKDLAMLSITGKRRWRVTPMSQGSGCHQRQKGRSGRIISDISFTVQARLSEISNGLGTSGPMFASRGHGT